MSMVLWMRKRTVQYIPRNMQTVFVLLCFVVVIHWLIFPYPSSLLHWHCDNLRIAPVPAKQPWWIWINTSCEFIMNDCITTTKQRTTKPCAYFLGYTVHPKLRLIDFLAPFAESTKFTIPSFYIRHVKTKWGVQNHIKPPLLWDIVILESHYPSWLDSAFSNIYVYDNVCL